MSKKRKPSSPYKLSADSVKSGNEFGYASRLASALKKSLATLVFGQYGNALHKRLQSRITAAIRRGPETMKGARTLADGDASLLAGLELNPYTQFLNLTNSLSVRTTITPTTNALDIEIPSMAPDHFEWPDRAQESYLNVRCLLVDVQRAAVESHALEPIVLARSAGAAPARKATVQANCLEGRMVLVAVGVSFFRTDSEGRDGLVSQNRKYYAASIVEAAFIKDGQVVAFVPEDKKPSSVSPVPDIPTIKWDEGDA